jgi:hypothetical protein
MQHPQRVSSREDVKPRAKSPQRPPLPSKGLLPSIQPRQTQVNTLPQNIPTQALEQPSPLPGNDTNTSNLSFIPTLTIDKRADHKKKEETKKSSWGWLLGKEDGEKEKAEKPKAKITKPPQQHDNTRLDVLQSSIDGGKGRESLVLDREHLKLDEERKKESQRKSSGSDKKEKEGLFSSIFGGKKGKGDKDGSSKKHRDRSLTPEPPYRELKPDIDYNWTRFSILEERAIYRMAHIKLANPRRALYSQVLLSNFMYSYLAKVQQMHPQMNLPTSAKQQRNKQPATQAKEPATPQQQPDEFTQYQRYQQVSRTKPPKSVLLLTVSQQQAALPPHAESSYERQQSVGHDTSGYNPDPSSSRPSSRGSKVSLESTGPPQNAVDADRMYNQYYHNQPHAQGMNQGDGREQDDDDMW